MFQDFECGNCTHQELLAMVLTRPMQPHIFDLMTDTLTTIRTRRAEIIKLRQALDDEEKELTIAERVIERLAASTPVTVIAPNANGAPLFFPQQAPDKPGRQPTHKELIIGTLRTVADPWVESSRVLHAKIKEIHGVDINFTGTFQPTLSDLKKAGTVLRDGPKIALAERIVRALSFEQKKEGAAL